MDRKEKAAENHRRTNESFRDIDDTYIFDPANGLYQPKTYAEAKRVEADNARDIQEHTHFIPANSSWAVRFQAIFAGLGVFVSILTLGLLLFTVMFAHKQWQEMHNTTVASIDSANSAATVAENARLSLEQSRSQFIQDQRPYIWHDTLQGEESDPRFYAMRVYYTNYGRSPAFRFSSAGHIFCEPDALAKAYEYLDRLKKERKWDSINSIVPPGIDTGLPQANRGYDTFTTDPETPRQRLLCSGEAPLMQRVVVGAWEYYDASGKRYYGEFCNGVHLGIKRGYDAAGSCDKHNDGG